MSTVQEIRLITGQLRCNCGPTDSEPKTWCPHIRTFLAEGKDVDLLHPDHHLVVPIFPDAGIYGEVWIGEDKGNGSAIMSLNFTPDIGRPYSVRLGFWNPGEGMRVIATVVVDYLRSKLHPAEDLLGPGAIQTRCPAKIHTFKNSRVMAEQSEASRNWKRACLWNIVMEDACTVCVEESSGSVNNFGLGNL